MAPAAQPNVNVIFHGLFLFIERDESIDVLIPNMGDEHVYRAGAFLCEETLHERPLATPYFLSGVHGSKAKLAKSIEKKSILFPGEDYDTTASMDQVYARILLPKPAELIPLRPTRDPLIADVDPENRIKVKNPCGVHIFRYHADELTTDAVALTPHPYQPGFSQDKKFLNLHIFSEPDCKQCAADHASNGFEKLLQLLPGVRTTIHFKNQTPLESIDALAKDVAGGVAPVETWDLIERQALLEEAGQAWRAHAGFELKDLTGTEDSAPFSCLPGWGGGGGDN